MNRRHRPYFSRTFVLAFAVCATLPVPLRVWGQSLPPAMGTTRNATPPSPSAPPPAKVPTADSEAVYTAASLPPNGVHIPFKIIDGLICVRANLAGRTVDCELDTGDASTDWPAWFKLPGQRHEDKAIIGKDANGLSMPQTPVVLPFIRIGAFETRDVATFAVDTECKNAKDAMHSDCDLDRHPLLNSAIFFGTVLTIDYKHRELIVYPAQHNAVAEAQLNDAAQAAALAEITSECSAKIKARKLNSSKSSNDSTFAVMPFVLADASQDFFFGVPAVLCNFDGYVVQMEIDTGAQSPEILIDKAFAGVLLDKHRKQGEALKLHKTSFESIFGTSHIDVFPPLSFSFLTFNNRTLSTDAPNAPKALSDSFDEQRQRVGAVSALSASGCVSNTMLKRFARVTFDFNHNLLVLERNSPSDGSRGSSGGGSSSSGVDNTGSVGSFGNPGSVGNGKVIDGPPLPNGGILSSGGWTLPIPPSGHVVFAPNGNPIGGSYPSPSTTASTIMLATAATPTSGSVRPIITPMPNGGTVSVTGKVFVVPPGGSVTYTPGTGPAPIIVQNPPPSTTPPPTTAPASPAPTTPTTPTPGTPTAPTPPTTP